MSFLDFLAKKIHNNSNRLIPHKLPSGLDRFSVKGPTKYEGASNVMLKKTSFEKYQIPTSPP